MFRVFRADDVPKVSRLDYLRYVVSDLLVDCEPRHHGGDLSFQLSAGQIGALQVVDVDVTAGEVARTRHHIRRSDPDVYKLMVVRDGHGVVEQGGRQSRVGPGDLTVLDMSRPGRWSATAVRVVATTFPHALLPLPANKMSLLAGACISGTNGMGRLTSTFARQLPRHVGAATGAKLSTVLTDLLTATLTDHLGDGLAVRLESRQRALLVRIHAFIEERLRDPLLSPSTIAAAHHISPRYLYKLFATEQDSVAAWIRQRRLERCRRDLADPALTGRPVVAIAARWGFPSAAHFSRLFRETYGITPGEFRHAGLERFRSSVTMTSVNESSDVVMNADASILSGSGP